MSRAFHGFRIWLPVLIWAALIFYASTDLMSAPHTSRIICPLLRWLVPGIADETVGQVQFIVRKSGHMSEFAVLALLLWRARCWQRMSHAPTWNWPEARWVWLATTLYAASDEFHQSFVPSRDAAVLDVAIDAIGAALGLTGLWLIGRWRKHW